MTVKGISLKCDACGDYIELSELEGAAFIVGDNSIKFRYINGESVIWPYDQVMKEALRYILESHGSFEHFAEWGLIRPNY